MERKQISPDEILKGDPAAIGALCKQLNELQDKLDALKKDQTKIKTESNFVSTGYFAIKGMLRGIGQKIASKIDHGKEIAALERERSQLETKIKAAQKEASKQVGEAARHIHHQH